MAIKTLRVFQEFTSEGYVPMPIAGNIDYGVTIAGTFPGTTPTTFQTDDPDIDVTLTATTDYYVWIRSHGTDWNPMYTRNVRVYPDSPLVNNVVMGIIIANLSNTVPYVGATEDVDLGEFGLTAGYLGLDLTPTLTPTVAGTMSWNDADGTANLILKGGNVTLQIGQEQVTRIVNKTGANLLEANYQAVRVSGAQGNRLKVDLAQANIDANSAETLGLVTETINNNAEGFITTSGLVRNIDTTGTLQGETWIDGDILYLSGTTAGRVTNIKPQAPTHTVIMGYVVRAHQTQGQIYVKVDNGYELDELHNVKITSVVNKNILVYETATSLWKNRNIFGTQGYVPYYDDTLLMKNSVIYTDGTQVIIGDDEEFSVGNKLSVVGNIAVDKNYGYHSGLYQILFRQDATGEFRIGTNAANDYTTFYANGTERVRISPSGFLGVGVSNPLSILHVKGTTAYTNAIIDNNSASGGGYYSAYQNGAEKAIFGVSGAWLLDNSSDAALIAKGVGQGIQFYTNGSTSEKMGINSDGNVFVGQTPTYVAGATQLVVRGKTGAGFVGVNHYDMSIKGFMNTFNSVFQVGTSTFHSLAFLVEDIERGRVNSSGRLLWGTTTDNTTDLVQINGSLIATSLKKSGGLSNQFLKADGSVDSTTYGTGSVTSVALSAPSGFSVSGSPVTSSGTLALGFAVGYSLPSDATQATWTAKQNALNGTGFVKIVGTTISYDNSTYYLASNPSAYISGITSLMVTNALGYTPYNSTNPSGYISGITSGMVTTALGYTPVTNARQLTINGTTYDLSADRSWTISGTIGGLTSGYIPKATSASTLGNSLIYDNGTQAGFLNEGQFAFYAGGSYSFAINGVNVPYFGFASGVETGGSGNATVFISGYDSLKFYTTNSERMRLTSGGNLLVGTTTDSGYKLNVSGTGNFSSALTGTSASFTANVNGDDYNMAAWKILDWTGSVAQIGGIAASQWNQLEFFTSGTSKLILNGTGNLGLGVTPSAWGVYKAYQVGYGAIASYNDADTAIFSNAYFDGGTWRYIGSSYASQYRQLSSTHSWHIAPYGTAGTAISFTQAMTLDASGNLLLGATANSQGAKLKISGGYVYLNEAGGADVYFRSAYDTNKAAIQVASANDLAFVTSNATRMTLTSAGNVLIGTTADSGYKLDVNGTGRFSETVRVQSSTTWANINVIGSTTSQGGQVDFYGSTVRYGTIVGEYESAGNGKLTLRTWQGSGTTPISALTLASTGAATFSSSVTAGGDINANTNTASLKVYGFQVAKYSYFGYSTGYPGVLIGSSGSQSLFFNVDISGNPSGAFGGSGNEYVWRNAGSFITPNAANNAYNTLLSWNSSGQLTIPQAATFSSSVTAGGNITSGGGAYDVGGFFLPYSTASAASRNWKITNDQISFGDFSIKQSSTQSGLPDTVRFYINPSGNVGIGTSSPRNNGAGQTAMQITGADYPIFSINGTNNGIGGVFGIGSVTSYIGTYSSHGFSFVTSDTERMRITSGGNVLIGTTTDSGYKLDVNGTGRIQNAIIGENGYGVNYAQFSHQSRSSNSQYSFLSGNVGETYINSVNGYPIYFRHNNIDLAIITSGGNLLINTTTDSGYKLNVNGYGGFANGLYTLGVNGDNASFSLNHSTSYTTLRSSLNGTRSWQIDNVSNNFWLYMAGSLNTYVLTIAQATGAATFSSSVSAYGNASSSSAFNLYNTAGASGTAQYYADFGNGSGFVAGRILRGNGASGYEANGLNIDTHTGMQIKLNTLGGSGGTFAVIGGASTFSSSVTATSFFESSDKTIKTLLIDNYQTKGIESITAKLYTKHGKEELGYFAQDVQGILPSAVTMGTNGLLNLSYREVLVAKVQRTETEIEKLKNRVLELETQLNLR